MLKAISNFLWIILGGLWLAILWGFIGILLCITIIGIPFGIQCFKLARLSFSPYGKHVDYNFSKHPIANTIWAIFGGWEMALIHFFVGLINCITILGIPRGIQCFKIMKLAFFPFGATIKK